MVFSIVSHYAWCHTTHGSARTCAVWTCRYCSRCKLRLRRIGAYSGVHTPNSISIGSSVSAGLTLVTDRQTETTLHVWRCALRCGGLCVCVWWNVRGGGAANAVDKRTTTRAALTHNIVEADDDIFTDESAQQAYNTIIAHTGHADLPMCEHYTLQLCVMRGVIFRESWRNIYYKYSILVIFRENSIKRTKLVKSQTHAIMKGIYNQTTQWERVYLLEKKHTWHNKTVKILRADCQKGHSPSCWPPMIYNVLYLTHIEWT